MVFRELSPWFSRFWIAGNELYQIQHSTHYRLTVYDFAYLFNQLVKIRRFPNHGGLCDGECSHRTCILAVQDVQSLAHRALDSEKSGKVCSTSTELILIVEYLLRMPR